MTADANLTRLIRNRSQASLDRGVHVLRPGQIIIEKENIRDLGEGHGEGYFVGMTGVGKTVWSLNKTVVSNTTPGGKRMWDVPTLILVPTIEIRKQYYQTAIGDLFQIPPDKIGVYNPSNPNKAERRSELGKDVVVMSYAMARRLLPASTAIQKKVGFDLSKYRQVIVDEPHMDPRGDITGAVIRKHCKNMYIVGGTATHVYMNGKTVGDYFFQGRVTPFYEQTLQEAVNLGSVPSTINVVAEVDIKPGATVESEGKIPERAKEQLIEDEALLQAFLTALRTQKHPLSGKPLKEMKQLAFFRTVDEAHRAANIVNAEFGEGFMRATSSRTEDMRNWEGWMRDAHQNGTLMVVGNMKKLLTGYDDPGIEAVHQVRRMGSPIESMQSGGRVNRFHPKDKKMVKLIYTYVPKDSRSVLFGEVAGGFAALDESFEYGQTFQRQEMEDYKKGKLKAEEPPVVEGVRFYTTPRQFAFLREKRREQQWHDKLQIKTEDMLAVDEMAKLVGVPTEILEKHVFSFLRDAYDIRRAEQRYIEGRHLASDDSDMIPLRGQRFPTWRMGYYRNGRESTFYLDKDAAGLCRYVLFGHIKDKNPDWLSRTQAKIILDIGDTQLGAICKQVQDAYVNRSPYQRVLSFEIANADKKIAVKLPVEHVLFFKEKGAAKIAFAPEAFVALHQMSASVDEKTAQEWWNKHRALPKLKSHFWLNDVEFASELGIDSTNTRFHDLWKNCKARCTGQLGKLGDHIIHGENKRSFDTSHQQTFCMHHTEAEWLKWKLNMENAYDHEKDKQNTSDIPSAIRR